MLHNHIKYIQISFGWKTGLPEITTFTLFWLALSKNAAFSRSLSNLFVTNQATFVNSRQVPTVSL